MQTTLPTSPEDLADPFDFFAYLRRSEPVAWDEEHELWLVATHADVSYALNHPELFSNHIGPMSQLGAPMMVTEDPPSHTRLRRLVSGSFTPRRVRDLQQRVDEIIDGVMAGLQRSGPFVDLVPACSYPAPVTVIAELLGISTDNMESIWRWSFEFLHALERGDGWSAAAAPVLDELHRYFDAAIAEHRANPRDDLIGGLLEATEGEVGLTDGELFNMCLLLMVAGNETTTNLISNSVAAMVAHPDAYQRLVADPDLAPGWIEEVLRTDGSIRSLFRIAAQDVELGGKSISTGEKVLLLIASANRDEAVFESADQFIPERNPKTHIAFARGIHFCLGAPLARLEGTAAVRAFSRRFPNVALDPDRPAVREDLVITRGYRSLPLILF